MKPGITGPTPDMSDPTFRVRVLAYSDSADFSGAEAFFCSVVQGLSFRSTFDLTCAAPGENAPLNMRLRSACGDRMIMPARAQETRLAAAFLYHPLQRLHVRRLLEHQQWDVLLVNLPSIEYGSTPLLSRSVRYGPVVGLLHVHQRLADVGFRLGRLRDVLAARAIRRLDALCVLSPWARDAVETSLVDVATTSVHVIRAPRPQVTLPPQAEAREQLGLPLTGTIIGLAGRISIRQKGHDVLIEAARLLAERGRAIDFALAGDGRDRRNVEEAIRRNGLADRFHFLGKVESIGPFLSAIDAVAIPSRFEGLPLIALEALQSGKPGIVTSIDGLRQIWPEKWQVPAGDPVAMADGLERLVSSPPVAAEMREAVERSESFVTNDPGSDVARVILDVIRKRESRSSRRSANDAGPPGE